MLFEDNVSFIFEKLGDGIDAVANSTPLPPPGPFWFWQKLSILFLLDRSLNCKADLAAPFSHPFFRPIVRPHSKPHTFKKPIIHR